MKRKRPTRSIRKKRTNLCQLEEVKEEQREQKTAEEQEEREEEATARTTVERYLGPTPLLLGIFFILIIPVSIRGTRVHWYKITTSILRVSITWFHTDRNSQGSYL